MNTLSLFSVLKSYSLSYICLSAEGNLDSVFTKFGKKLLLQMPRLEKRKVEEGACISFPGSCLVAYMSCLKVYFSFRWG